jgi:hypothetical protein
VIGEGLADVGGAGHTGSDAMGAAVVAATERLEEER